ncbi:MAG: hypothetical protein V4677_15600 [Bacteroidota bacterium]
MKASTLIFSLTMCILFSNCKKDHVCECYNPGGVFKTYTIKDTKVKAKKKCDDYSKEYQDVAWSETGCELK